MATSSAKYSKTFIKSIEEAAYEKASTMNLHELEALIKAASHAYYNTDTPILTDDTFDILIDVLKSRDPDSPVLNTIGSTVPVDAPNKVKLPYHLGSMDKVKPGSRELNTWLSKYKGPYIISEKLDGLSGLLIIKLTNTSPPELSMKLYRRGDDDISQEVGHLISLINIVPANKHRTIIDYILKHNPSSRTLAVRGELIVKKSVFTNKYSSKYPKARSFINGLALSKPEAFNNQVIRTMAHDIDYVTYNILDPGNVAADDQFKTLHQLGFNTAVNKKFDKLDTELLQETLLEYKRESAYEIDGIIVADNSKVYPLPTSGNPKYAVAFKMRLAEQEATTIVEYVEYNVTKNMLLKPRVRFAPVKIGGDTITFATGFNAKFIKDNVLGPGAEITIIKSGDVIPYIQNVIKPAPDGWSEPEVAYKWSDSGVDVYPTDMKEVPEYLNKDLGQFFDALGVDGLRAGTLDRLINAGFTTINSILSVNAESLISIEGFQIKSANKLVTNIRTAILDKEHPLPVLMNASNIFTGFGVKKLSMLVSGIKDIQRIITGKPHEISLSEIIQLEGFQEKTARAFLDALPEFRTWLSDHPLLKVMEVVSKDTSSPNTNPQSDALPAKLVSYLKRNIVFTGFRDESVEKLIEQVGGRVQSGISGTTNLVVANSLDKASSKIEKAREKGIEVISKTEFLDQIKKGQS